MKTYPFLIFCLLSYHLIIGQTKGYTFEDIPLEQLEMTKCAVDSNAAAVILHDYGIIKVKRGNRGFVQSYIHKRRIKILDKRGLERGDIEIPYYSYENQERLLEIMARVVHPNGQIFNLTQEDFFTEKKSKYWSVKKLATPQLKVGAIIEYYYEIESERITQLREWYFQTDIPILISKLTINFHPNFSYMSLFQGFDGMEKIEKGPFTILKNATTEAILDSNDFTIKNIPALKTEPFITTINDHRLRIRFQLSIYTTEHGIVNQVLSAWHTVTDKILNSPSFEIQYTKSKYCGKIVKAASDILKKEIPQLDKAKALYKFINDNVEVNQNSGIYVETSLNEAFEEKSASKSELNLMLLALLQKVNIESYPVLISTRDNGYAVLEHPIIDQFNRTILLVIIDGKNYFVSQGNKLRPFGELARNSMNQSGYSLRRPIGKWLPIIPNKSQKIIISDFNLDDEGNLKGKITVNYTNIEAVDNREYWINKEGKKTWEEELENTIVDFELESVTVENERDLEKPFKVHFKGDFTGAVTDLGNFMYISPFIFSDFSENPFKSEKRQYPVDFPHLFSNQFIINIKYDSADYYVEELPKDTKFELLGKKVTVRYAAQERESGWIQITYALSVNEPYFPVDTYENLRSLFDITAEKLGEQIVLKKL